MRVTKSAIVDYNIPHGVIVRQDTVLDDGRTVTNMVDITTVEELTYVRDALNKALYMMERLKK